MMMIFALFVMNAIGGSSKLWRAQRCYEEMYDKTSRCEIDNWDSDWDSGNCTGLGLRKMKLWGKKNENHNKIPLVFEQYNICAKTFSHPMLGQLERK